MRKGIQFDQSLETIIPALLLLVLLSTQSLSPFHSFITTVKSVEFLSPFPAKHGLQSLLRVLIPNMDANNNFISTNNNNGLVPQIRQMMNELIQGRDLAKHLQSTLSSSSSQSQSKEWLMIQRIIESFEKSIEILKSEPFYNQQSPLPIAQTTTDSPHSGFSGSPKSQDSDGDYSFKDLDLKSSDHLLDPRKRKLMVPVEKRRVPGSSDSGLEGPIEDGYSWRKYGQKDILGATYPRAYYRCTFRQGQGCFATKQVQRNDDDPTLFDVVYRGKHTCSQAPSSSSLLNPTDSIKLEPSETLPYHHHQKQQSHGVIWSFGSEPKDIKPIITNNKLMHHSSSYFTFQYPSQNPTSSCDHQAPTSFPYDNNNHITTTNHGDFSTNFNPNDQQHAIHLQSEVVPATSGTDSPAMAVPAPRFSFDQGEFDQHDIMFDIPEFY